MPSPKKPDFIEQSGWKVYAPHGAILSNDEVDEWESELFALPEQTFGATRLQIDHAASGFRVELNAREALRALRGQPASAELPYREAWKGKEGMATPFFGPIKVQEYNYDWTYATTYGGTVTERDPSSDPSEQGAAMEPRAGAEEDGIDQSLLARPDPILFFDELVLYEDDLADNGACKLSVKLRVRHTLAAATTL